MPEKHAAIKCTYNNGGEDGYVGFADTCTEDIIKYNIKWGHVWCNHEDCKCMEYYNVGFKGKRPPVSPCMESKLFKEWVFGSGWFYNGRNAWKPRRANITSGGIALLTTRFPNEKESSRRIVGLYKISRITNNVDEETILFADKHLRIRLPIEESKELYFWDYYTINASKPSWGSGLLRYLNDEQIWTILDDLKKTVQSNAHREIVGELQNEIDGSKHVHVTGLRKNKIDHQKRIALKRKYGAGGEGENHKRLKEWISNNPQAINVSKTAKCEIEYSFCCGDTVDLLFKQQNGQDIVVEIETDFPFPGAHQVIKYRALRCAEKGYKLSDSSVKSILVAWKIPADIKSFCKKYGIETYEFRK